MAKIKSVYICSQCGYESPKWYGKCPTCGEWNTMEEEIKESLKAAPAVKRKVASAVSSPYSITEITTENEHRYDTGCSELNRVLGGGIVKGSLILLGGDPGIGKSTVLLQICQYLGNSMKVLYVSGEESQRQLKLRANRLGVNSPNLFVMTETDVEVVCEQIRAEKPDIVMIDSIQTMNLTELSSSPGSVTQVRESTNYLMRTAKSLDIPMFVVGHVNKEGSIAGPKVLEHIVDTVLHFEGDKQMSCRILRAVKNRYGSTNEIGVFEMSDHGLLEVQNPSAAMLAGHPQGASGNCIACVMEGSRPLLAEVQALAAKTQFGVPRRTAAGVDYNRMVLLLAILEKRCGLFLSSSDVYVNVVGGMRLDEPAVDLPMVLAIASSFRDKPLPEGVMSFGEVGLTGELRAVSNPGQRINEAYRLGFHTCIMPMQDVDEDLLQKMNIVRAKTVGDAIRAVL